MGMYLVFSFGSVDIRFVPDYYVLSTSHWILYPWSRYESARLLWRQMSAQVPSEDLLSQLSSLLGLDEEKIRRVVLGAQQPG